MSEENFKLKRLDWDTAYFGVSAGKAELYKTINKTDKDIIESWRNGIEFLTLSNYDNNTNNNQWISNYLNGFNVDINIQFHKTVKNNLESNGNISIQNDMLLDENILNIANEAFVYSRFINDSNLGYDKKRKVYYHWVLNSFGKQNKYFVKYKIENKSVGFILFSINDSKCNLELIAINSKYQGSKVGQKLMNKLEQYLFQNDISAINVGTQLVNKPAVNFYINNGFKYKQCISTYHVWNK